MTWGRKTGGRDFKKGVVTNPKGRPRIPAELKEARGAQAAEVEMVIYKYMNSTIDSLRAAITNPKTPAKEIIIIKILVAAIEKSDEKRFDFILNRSIGKVVDKLDHTIDTKRSILVQTDGTKHHFVNKDKDE